MASVDRPTSTNTQTAIAAMYNGVRYGIDNTIGENSSVFSLIRMHWLPSARACGQ